MRVSVTVSANFSGSARNPGAKRSIRAGVKAKARASNDICDSQQSQKNLRRETAARAARPSDLSTRA